MKHALSLAFCFSFLIPVFYLSAADSRSVLSLDYQGASAMMDVLQLIHDGAAAPEIGSRLNTALGLEAYRISAEQYDVEKKGIDLQQFRTFMLSLADENVDTLGNRRLEFLKDYFLDAVKNPEKYRRALAAIGAISQEEVRGALDRALFWLPQGVSLNVKVLVLFDIGGGAWAYKAKNGQNYSAFSLPFLLDEKGEFDSSMFLLTLAHELHHLGIPVDAYYQSIGYDKLPPGSPLRLYSEYVVSMIKEGMAQKFCSNAPGKLTDKPDPQEEYAAVEEGRRTWDFFISEFDRIHLRAVRDMEKIVAGEIRDVEGFWSDFSNYWTWRAGSVEGRQLAPL